KEGQTLSQYAQIHHPQNLNPMNQESLIQEALRHLENANYAGYFEKMEAIREHMPSHLKPIYAQHKGKFMAGQHEWNFNQQLAVFAKELISADPNPASSSRPEIKTIIQQADKIYNIKNIEQANFNGGSDSPEKPNGGAQGEAATPESKQVSNKTLIELLNEAFDDEAFSLFCFIHYEELKRNFTVGQPKMQKIMMLIKHCQQHIKVDELLRNIQQERPAIYKKHLG
ncbi:MAG: hypothetical protein AAFU64_08635, partial [Bacteroidota bacterium]